MDIESLIREIESIEVTQDKIDRAWASTQSLSSEVTCKYELDAVDKAICFAAGILAAAVDMFLVTDVRRLSTDNKLGFTSDGNKLKNSGFINKQVDQRLNNLFPSDKVKSLEDEFWVPYDASSNSEVEIPIKGMNMMNHRLHSLGHDPILGFYYGVRDIMRGQFTALGTDGSLIIQNRILPEGYHIKLFEAIGRQFGHLGSDIATEQGLPIPFMSQLLRFTGPSGYNGKTIAELADYMYKYGYNFTHLLSMSVPCVIIEVINRLGFFGKAFFADKRTFKESIPINQPKLDKMLFYSYMVASASNGVKIAATRGNIFALNPTIWSMCMRYGFHEMCRWLKDEEETKRHAHVVDIYNRQSVELDAELNVELLRLGINIE